MNDSTDTDNRDPQEMFLYYEARIESMVKRIHELEEENRELRQRLALQEDLERFEAEVE